MSKVEVFSASTLLKASPIESRRFFRLMIVEDLIRHFESKGSLFWSALRYVEFTPLFFLRRRSVEGTIFEPIARHLNKMGVPVDNTVGSVMYALDLDRTDVHNLACHCLSKQISGKDAARRLDYHAQYFLRF